MIGQWNQKTFGAVFHFCIYGFSQFFRYKSTIYHKRLSVTVNNRFKKYASNQVLNVADFDLNKYRLYLVNIYSYIHQSLSVIAVVEK